MGMMPDGEGTERFWKAVKLDRIMVLGPIGAGKTTLCRELGDVLKLPVTHLDAHFWQAGWRERPQRDWLELESNLASRPRWIADGNYLRSMHVRLARATLAIHLDYPPWLSTPRFLWRTITNLGRGRPDLPDGCPDRFALGPFVSSLTYRSRLRPVIEKKMEARPATCTLLTLSNNAQARLFLEELRYTAGL